MTFHPISDLFKDRIDSIGDADIQIYIERFLHEYIQHHAFYCSVQNMGKVIKIRVHTPTLAQHILLLERDVRLAIKQELNCDIDSIRVMLE